MLKHLIPLALLFAATPAHGQTATTAADKEAARIDLRDAFCAMAKQLCTGINAEGKPNNIYDRPGAEKEYSVFLLAHLKAKQRIAGTPAQTCDLAGAAAKGRADERAAIVEWIEGRK